MPRKKAKPDAAPPDDGFVPQVPPAPDRQTIADSTAILAGRLLNELAGRKIEALRLYRPLPAAEPFHKDDIRTKLGLGSNQAGKTLVAALEFARAVTGQDPHGKYPLKDGIAFIFGLDGKHLGSTIYRKVFRAGAFDIIKDLDTDEWRVFHPINDAKRAKEAKPAPPLIPRRFIKSIAWEDKKSNVPKLITLHNGWELHFFSSLGSMPQGQQIDLAWIDEEISNEALFDELVARCMKRGGRVLWSATPQNASLQLFELHEIADLQKHMKVPDVREYKFRIVDNPYISEAEKQRVYRTWQGDQREIRYHGEFAIKHLVVYPEFDLTTHGHDDRFVLPLDWCVYFATDPGYETCGTLFLAIPPPSAGKFAVLFDELYLKKCDANMFAKAVKAKKHQSRYEAGYIDLRFGRQHETGTGQTYEEHYRRALVRNGVEMRNGTHFTWAADDPKAGIEAVRDWLRIQPHSGKPFLRVVGARLENFMAEIKRYRYKRVRKNDRWVITDEPDKTSRADHLMDCLRYLAAASPGYRRPKPAKAMRNPVVVAMEKKRSKSKETAGGVSLG